MSELNAVRWNTAGILVMTVLMALSVNVQATSTLHNPSAGSSSAGYVTLGGSLPHPLGLSLGTPLSSSAAVAGALSFQGLYPSLQAQMAEDVNNPASPLYHHFLTGNQFDSLFAPSRVQQNALTNYLESHGVMVTVISPYLWNVEGTASAMGSAFGTTFVNAQAPGHAGYYPLTPPQLPATFSDLAQINSGFQTLFPPTPADFHVWDPSPVVSRPATPHAAIVLNMSMNGPFFKYHTSSTYVHVPTNYNGTYELNITGGTPPYSVTWRWGDGTVQKLSTSAAHLNSTHMYYNPPQADYYLCGGWSCVNITVFVNDSASNFADMVVGVLDGVSSTTLQRYYNILPLFNMGFTGQGTKIGLDEMCDKTYTSYLADANIFSTWMKLPQFTSSTLQLIGTGASKCTLGSSGWAGETMLDIEWAHTMAPNATLVVDLANSAISEGDCAWNTLSNGVYIASNSWGGSYTTSCWTKAASQGQSYLSASGDCGSLDLQSGSDPPADSISGVGVGGTQVYPTPSGQFRAEYAWNGTNDTNCLTNGQNDAGSGGGYSTSIAAPAFQVGMTGFSGSFRGIPDIAAIGGTWVELFDSGYSNVFILSAGTSLACPASAAMLDIMYQYNHSASKANGMADYDLYNIAKSGNYNIGFHDILIGNNIVSGTGYTDHLGWDAVTGLGSFNVAQLAQLLAVQNGNASGIAPLTAIMTANVTFGPATLAVYFGADVAGGPASLSGYAYSWIFGDGATATTSTYSSTHAYATPGIYQAYVNVSAGAFSVQSNKITVTVSSVGPAISAFSASPNPDYVNTATTFTVVASGGKTPYTYAYTGLPTGCTSSSTASLPCTPTVTGTFTVSVTVTDANMKTATSSTTLSVVSLPTVSSFSASPNPVTVNTATTFSVTASGGVAPYTYAYSGLPTGCTSSNTATLPCTPTATGSFPVTVTVSDANSKTATKSTTLTVVAALAVSSFSASPNPVTVNTATTFTTTATGGSTPYTYAYTGLPAGCTPSSTASLPCTPTATGTFTVSVTVTDANSKTATSSTTLTVASLPTVSSFSASPNPVTVNTATTFSVAVSGGVTPYTYVYTGLPAGCASSNTSSLPCTPTATGTFTVTVTVTDANSKTATKSTSLTVNAVSIPTISSFTASPNPVTVNTATTLSVTVTGGTLPYSYVYTGLPTGCTSSNTNSLSCTPTATGAFNVTVTVTDVNNKTASKNMTLTVNAVSLPTITAFSATPNPVTVSTATTLSVAVSGGTTPYSYVYTGLPTGCTSSNTNSLSCTPTATGTFNVTVTVTDVNSKTASKNMTLTVNAVSLPTITAFSATPNPVTVSTATTLSVAVSGGTTPYSYVYTGLPTGCTSSNTNSLSCTPTATGTFNVSVTVTDANSKTASKSISLTVNPASVPTISAFAASPNPVLVNSATTFSTTVTGGTTPYSYVYGGLPAGCTSSNTNSLSCTPTATGTFNVTVTVTDANSKTASKNTTLTVNAVSLPTITAFSATPNPVTVNTATTLSAAVSGGTTPYSFIYTGLPAGCTSSNTNSLSCTPTATGTFNVTVTVTDANSKTASKNTTLTVNAVASGPIITAFTVSPNPVTVNATATFTVTATGGTIPYVYSYAGLPAGCTSSSTASLSCTPTSAGSYAITVIVTDANGKTASKTVALTVSAFPLPSITTFTASPNPVNVNAATSFSVTVSGGTTPYSYVYTGLPPGCVTSSTATLSCAPTSSGIYHVTVVVTDANGQKAANTTQLMVSSLSGPTITAFTASPNPITLNGTTKFTVLVSGGSAPYSYAYKGLPNGCASSNTASLTCTPSMSGTFSVTVTVTDAIGKYASAVTSLVVNQGPSALSVTAFVAIPNSLYLGNTTVLSVTTTGGSTPLSYAYAGLPQGCTTQNLASFSCTPSTTGSFTITVTVTDANGKTASKTVSLNVNNVPTSTPLGYGSGMLYWVLVVALLAATAVLVVVVMRRHRRGPSKDTDAEPVQKWSGPNAGVASSGGGRPMPPPPT